MDLSSLLEHVQAMEMASPEDKRKVEAYLKALIASRDHVAEAGEEPPTAENQEAVGGDQSPIPPGREVSLAGSVVNEQQLPPRDRAPMAPERPVSLTGSAAMANDDASIAQEVLNVPGSISATTTADGSFSSMSEATPFTKVSRSKNTK